MTSDNFHYRSPETGIQFYYGPVNSMEQSHRHASIELNMLESGCMSYSLSQGNFTLRPKTLLVFNGMRSHASREVSPDTRLYWFLIPIALIASWTLPSAFLDALMGGQLILNEDADLKKEDLALFRRWQKDLMSGDRARIRIILLEVLVRLERLALSPQNSRKTETLRLHHDAIDTTTHSILDKMVVYILSHFRDHITLDDIATQAQVSPQYAIRIFKKTFGLSPMKFVREQRLDYAGMLLLTTDLTVLDIANQSGFQNASRFYEAFQKYKKLSPGTFRKKANTE